MPEEGVLNSKNKSVCFCMTNAPSIKIYISLESRKR
jgi:hypothetical protein